MSRLLAPASRMNVRGVGIDPEVMALSIPIKVQAQAVATHLAMKRIRGTSMPVDATLRLLHLSWSSLPSQESSASRFPEC